MYFLERLDHYVQRVLCYPMHTCILLEKRIQALLEDGFIYLVSTGRRIQNLRILGKGYSSIVTIAHHRKAGIGSLKILRIDSRRDSLEREGEFLRMIEDIGIAPRVILYRDFYLFYELLPPHKCRPLIDYLDIQVVNGVLDEVKRLLHRVVDALYSLDKRRIDHTELNRPGGHIMYCDGLIKVLDWESARITPKPTNLSSFISYIIFRYHNADKLRRLLDIKSNEVILNLRIYKERYDEESYRKLINAMSLRDVDMA